MTCEPVTCNNRHAIKDKYGNIELSNREFIKNLLHLKCKVIRLVQDQMKESKEKVETHYQKGNQTNTEVSAMPNFLSNSITRTTATDALGNSTRISSTSIYDDLPYIKHIPAVSYLSPSHTINNNTTWRNSISRRIPHCGNILLAGLVLGVLVWMSLLYGALLGASLCGHGLSSLPFMSFANSQTRDILF